MKHTANPNIAFIIFGAQAIETWNAGRRSLGDEALYVPCDTVSRACESLGWQTEKNGHETLISPPGSESIFYYYDRGIKISPSFTLVAPDRIKRTLSVSPHKSSGEMSDEMVEPLLAQMLAAVDIENEQTAELDKRLIALPLPVEWLRLDSYSGCGKLFVPFSTEEEGLKMWREYIEGDLHKFSESIFEGEGDVSFTGNSLLNSEEDAKVT